MSDEVFDRVIEELLDRLEPGHEEQEIGLNSRLLEDLGIGSLAAVDLVVSAEDAFDIDIADDEMAEIVTVGDLVRLIDGKRE